jgi:hypothetical protein
MDSRTMHSPSGAETWLRRWQQVLSSLESGADGCGIAPEDEDHDIDIRQVIFKTRRGSTYRALFTIDDDCVFVMHIRGPGQDLVSPADIALPEP